MTNQMHALVIEPAAGPRNRIRAAISNLRLFSSPHMLLSTEEAERAIKNETSTDIVFISNRVGLDNAIALMVSLKAEFAARDAAFILLMEGSTDRGVLAEIMLKGIDGFLIEPYSVDQLSEVVKIAERVKAEHRAARFKKAGVLLVKELIDQIDQLSALVRSKRPATISRAVLQDISSAIHQLDPELQAQFHTLVVDIFSSIETPHQATRVNSRSYTGCSERVRKRMAERAIETLRQAVG